MTSESFRVAGSVFSSSGSLPTDWSAQVAINHTRQDNTSPLSIWTSGIFMIALFPRSPYY